MPTVQPLALSRSENIVAAVDLGTSKLFCLIAELAMGRPRILGAAQHQAKGLKGGNITDLNQFSHCLQNVIDDAENSAGENVNDIYLAFSGGNLSGKLFQGHIPIEPGPISNSILLRALDVAENIGRSSLRSETANGDQKRELLHVIPAFYSIDGRHGIHDPRGIHADNLTLFANAVTISRGARKDLESLQKTFSQNRTHLLAAPWASALAVLNADEKNLGAIVIDIGAENTSVTEVRANALHNLAVIPTGGATITRNLATKLSITIQSAERIKTRHGYAFADTSSEHENIKVTPLGAQDETNQKNMPKAKLLQILQPSIENILNHIKQQLNKLDNSAPNHLVFTGGGSLLPGIDLLAEQILGQRPRLASPRNLAQLDKLHKSPAHAVSIGTLLWAMEQEDIVIPKNHLQHKPFWTRLSSPPQRWIKHTLGVEF
ncbi:MAG: cell division protein FtsA [Alphaproteobacteria bacterium]